MPKSLSKLSSVLLLQIFSLLIQHCFKYSLAFSLFHIIVMIIINFVFIIIGISLLHYFNQLHYFWSQCQTRCAACRCNDIVTEKINIAVFCISVQTDCYISKSVHKDISNEMDNTSLWTLSSPNIVIDPKQK